MPSWDHPHPSRVTVSNDRYMVTGLQPEGFDPDAIEVPEPYTADEWAETDGATQFGVEEALGSIALEREERRSVE